MSSGRTVSSNVTKLKEKCESEANGHVEINVKASNSTMEAKNEQNLDSQANENSSELEKPLCTERKPEDDNLPDVTEKSPTSKNIASTAEVSPTVTKKTKHKGSPEKKSTKKDSLHSFFSKFFCVFIFLFFLKECVRELTKVVRTLVTDTFTKKKKKKKNFRGKKKF